MCSAQKVSYHRIHLLDSINPHATGSQHTRAHERARERDGESVPEAGEALRGGAAGLPGGALRVHRLQDGAPRPRVGRRHRQRPGRGLAGEAVQEGGGHGHERAAAGIRAGPPQRALRPHPGRPDPGGHPRGRRATGLRRRGHRGAGIPLARPAALLRADALPAACARRPRRMVLHGAPRGGRRRRRLLAPLPRLAAALGAQPEDGRRRVPRRRLPLRPRGRGGSHGPLRVLHGAQHGPRRLLHVHQVLVRVPDRQGQWRRAARRGHRAGVRRCMGRRPSGGQDGEVPHLPQDWQGEASINRCGVMMRVALRKRSCRVCSSALCTHQYAAPSMLVAYE